MESKRILLVEDDPDNQELLKELIGSYNGNCCLTSVSDGDEAIKVAGKQDFDLVFMDMSVPKKDGCEIARSLRKTDKYQSVPIVALTAHAMNEMKEKALNSGCSEYLTKPCMPVDLLAVVKKYLDNKKKILAS